MHLLGSFNTALDFNSLLSFLQKKKFAQYVNH